MDESFDKLHQVIKADKQQMLTRNSPETKHNEAHTCECCHFTLKMETAWTSETLVSSHNTDDFDLKHHRCESLKICIKCSDTSCHMLISFLRHFL